MTIGDLIWLSIPSGYYDKLNSNVANSLGIANLALSMVTNAVTTIMIAYKLWYVAARGIIHWIQWLIMK